MNRFNCGLFVLLGVAAGVSQVFGAAAGLQSCEACSGESDTMKKARAVLEEAFRLSMEVADCSGATNLQSCRRIESRLLEALTLLGAAFDPGESPRECMPCDPRPHLSPLLSGLGSVNDLLATKGYPDFEPSHRRIQNAIERWGAMACCSGDEPAPPTERDREKDAKSVLIEKCGENFVKNRRGLRQVMRVPEDRRGCYQSRACRAAGRYQEFVTDAGFWTYDGEYWYIWKERQQPDGKWVDCAP